MNDPTQRLRAVIATLPSGADTLPSGTRAPIIPLNGSPVAGANGSRRRSSLIQPRGGGAPGEAYLPAEFWEARRELRTVHAAARSRRRSPDAVLAAVLARVASVLPHTARLDAGQGLGSANMIAVLVSRSGGGKSTAMDIAEDLITPPFHLQGDGYRAVPLGTGEGLAEQFMGRRAEDNEDGTKSKPRKVQVRHNGLFLVDEGEQMFRVSERKGATVMMTLRSMWSGQTLGAANATEETSRIVPRGSYSAAMLLGVQVAKAGPLFDEQAGGTLQRCLFAPARSHGAPRVKPDWPGRITLPAVLPGGTITYPDTVNDRIDHEAYLIDNEEAERSDPDAHEPSHLMKVSALLAVLAGRSTVTEADWELGETVWGCSVATREWVRAEVGQERQAAYAAADARHVERERQVHAARVDDAEAREYSQVVTLAGKLARRVDKAAGEPVARRTLRDQANGARRLLVGDALAHAGERGWIAESAPGWFIPGERNGEIPGGGAEVAE